MVSYVLVITAPAGSELTESMHPLLTTSPQNSTRQMSIDKEGIPEVDIPASAFKLETPHDTKAEGDLPAHITPSPRAGTSKPKGRKRKTEAERLALFNWDQRVSVCLHS